MNFATIFILMTAIVDCIVAGASNSSFFTIQMPGYSPGKNDDYVCTMIRAPQAYISEFDSAHLQFAFSRLSTNIARRPSASHSAVRL